MRTDILITILATVIGWTLLCGFGLYIMLLTIIGRDKRRPS